MVFSLSENVGGKMRDFENASDKINLFPSFEDANGH